jgi:hypothetical protein
MKGFSKATSSHMNKLLKDAGVENFSRIFKYSMVFSGFRKLVHVATSGFRNLFKPFRIELVNNSAFDKLFNSRII